MKWKPTEAQIRRRWYWGKPPVPATRENIRLAIRRTGNCYGLTPAAIPYAAPRVGMRISTVHHRPCTGTIVEVRKPLKRGGEPALTIQLDDPARPPISPFQTAQPGYRALP